jgi:hypothetical protein
MAQQFNNEKQEALERGPTIPPENEFPPELQHLLVNLDERQYLERCKMEHIHETEGIPDHMEPEVVGRHNEKQMHDLVESHATERERYINEFYDAQRIAEEMKEADKAQAMEQGEEKGFSK